MRAQGTMLAKARVKWTPTPPDWIEELAQLVDRAGLKGAEKRVGYSPATISQVLSNSYRGDLRNVAERVRGALMGATVDCPEQGEMRRDLCLDWQGKPFAATSSHRVRMYRACRSGCPHSKHTTTKGDDHD